MFPGGHFDGYAGEGFERNASVHAEFLKEHLVGYPQFLWFSRPRICVQSNISRSHDIVLRHCHQQRGERNASVHAEFLKEHLVG
jgi:hypothetical protein